MAVRNRMTDRIYLYRDSQLDCDIGDNINNSNSIDSSGEPLFVGRDGVDSSTAYANAVMDDVRLYNYALSQSEINDLYNAGPGVADSFANFNDDEIVDFKDLKIFVEDWLETGY